MIDLPQEVRALNAAAELVEAMVNHLICCFSTNIDGLVAVVKPRNVIEEKYFFVLLLEMSARVNRELIPGAEHGDSLLTIIRQISDTPKLSDNVANARRLRSRSDEFLDWLGHEFARELYSAGLGRNVPVKIAREDALYLVGNRCKHSLVRSNRVMQKLAKKYRESGVEAAEGEEALLLNDIDDWFLDDFCLYHFTRICELCSNLYHAIIEYVRPEYESRVRRESGIAYSYEVPPELTRPDHIAEFYELLNRVRNPWVPVIHTERMLTLRY